MARDWNKVLGKDTTSTTSTTATKYKNTSKRDWDKVRGATTSEAPSSNIPKTQNTVTEKPSVNSNIPVLTNKLPSVMTSNIPTPKRITPTTTTSNMPKITTKKDVTTPTTTWGATNAIPAEQKKNIFSKIADVFKKQDAYNKTIVKNVLGIGDNYSALEDAKYTKASAIEGIAKIPQNIESYISTAGQQLIENTANRVQKNISDKTIDKLNPIAANIRDTAKNILPGINKTNKTYTVLANETSDKRREDYKKISDTIFKDVDFNKVSKVGEFAGGIFASIPQTTMLFIPGVGPFLFALSAAGGSSEQAAQQEATKVQQLAYGAVSGAVEVTLESLFGVVPGLKKVYKASPGSKKVLQIIKSAFSETLEEAATVPITGFAEKYIYNNDKKWVGKDGVFDWSQMGSEGAAGFVMSLMFSALSLPVSYVSNKKAQFLIRKQQELKPEEINDLIKNYANDVDVVKEKQPELLSKEQISEVEQLTKQEPTNTAQSNKPYTEEIQTGKATWNGENVYVTNDTGYKDGRQYVYLANRNQPVPLDEIVYDIPQQETISTQPQQKPFTGNVQAGKATLRTTGEEVIVTEDYGVKGGIPYVYLEGKNQPVPLSEIVYPQANNIPEVPPETVTIQPEVQQPALTEQKQPAKDKKTVTAKTEGFKVGDKVTDEKGREWVVYGTSDKSMLDIVSPSGTKTKIGRKVAKKVETQVQTAKIDEPELLKETDQEAKKLPMLGENNPSKLNFYADKLYHETSIDSAIKFIDPKWMQDMGGEIYFANTKDLAIGQGDNKGVIIEVKPTENIRGFVNKKKPTWEKLYEKNQAEFVANYNKQSDYIDSVISITIKKDATGQKAITNRLKRIVSNWGKVKNSDGSTTYIKPKNSEQQLAPEQVEVKPQAEQEETKPVIPKANIAYHAGDLGKAEHFGRFYGSDRGTGHFGTGTYFVGDKENLNLSSYKDRPMHEVDLSGYKLYKPTGRAEADLLHDMLKYVNNYSKYNSKRELPYDEMRVLSYGDPEEVYNMLIENNAFDKEEFEEYAGESIESVISNQSWNDSINSALKRQISDFEILNKRVGTAQYYKKKFERNIQDMLNISPEKANEIIQNIQARMGKLMEGKDFYSMGDVEKEDSMSTQFMKALGYEGIDVRHIKEFDNTSYGTVVYDLEKADDKQKEANSVIPDTKTTLEAKQDDNNVTETNDIRIVDGEVFYKDISDGTAPNGYAWFHNNKSRFGSSDRKAIILPDRLETKETQEAKPTDKIIKPEFKNKTSGKKGIAKDNEGNSIEFVYEVVDINSLITSHDTDMSVNPEYPAELQPRDRSRSASQMQINEIANNLQPEFLGENPKITDGSPIVGSDGVVESGNARTIAINKLYKGKHENYKKYITWLKDNADTFGIDKDKIFDGSILVRKRITDVDRQSFVKKANESSVAVMSSTETAKSDAEKLTDTMLDNFILNESGVINSKENQSFIATFIGSVVPNNEKNKYMTENGELSQEGLNRIKNAIFFKAYGDIGLMNKLSESLDNNVKNITNTLLSIAPKIIKIQSGIKDGTAYDVDFSKDIAEAVNVFSGLKKAETAINLYLEQKSFLDNDNTGIIKSLVSILNNNNKSTRKLTDFFNSVLDDVMKLGSPNQLSVFGAVSQKNKADVLEAAIRRFNDAKKQQEQIDFFEVQGIGSTKNTENTETGRQESGKAEKAVAGSQQSIGGKPITPKLTKHGTVNAIVKRSDIVEFLRERLDIPIGKGKFRERALGIFKVSPEVIRLKKINDIETLYHETGHFLDKQFQFTTSNFNSELLKLGLPTSRKSYTNKQVLAEGVAEFVRLYSVKKGFAQKEAPRFYSYFEGVINTQPQLRDMFDTLNILTDNYVNQSPVNKLMSNVSIDGNTKKRKMNLDDFYTKYFDDLHEMNVAVNKMTGGAKILSSENPYELLRRYKGSAGKAEGFLKFGIRNEEGKKISKSFDEILKPVGDNLFEFKAYLVAKRTIELHSRKIKTDEDTLKNARIVEQQYTNNAVFNTAMNELYDFQNKQLSMMVDAGLMSQEQETQIRKLNKYYVPFYRVMEGFSGRSGTGKGLETSSGIYKIKGSDKDIIDPLESIIKNTYFMVRVADKNRALVALSEIAKKYSGSGKIMDRVVPNLIPKSINVDNIRDNLIDLGADMQNVDMDKLITIFESGDYGKKDNVVTIFNNGKKEYWEIFDESFYRLFEGLDKESTSTLIKLMSAPAKLLRAGAVLNPDFMASNPVRDGFTAAIFSEYGFIPGYDTLKGLFHVIKQDEVYQKWVTSGAAGSNMVSMDREYYQKSLRDMVTFDIKTKAKNVITHPIDILRALSEFSEEATRVRVFEKGLNKEGSTKEGIAKSSMASREGTLDFSRSGYATKEINKVVAFFNSALQGPDKMVRTFKNKPIQTLLKAMTFVTLPSVFLWLFNHDDERYQELRQYEKDLYWIILTKDRMYRIPKPFELGMLFGSSVERALESIFNQNKKAFEGYAAQLFEVVSPEIFPTAFLPWIEALTNYDLFRNQQIVPVSEQNMEKSEQYGNYTSDTAKLIGKYFDLSPRIIDHIISGYGGGLANYGVDITDSMLRLMGATDNKVLPSSDIATRIPGVKKFVIAPFKSGGESINEIYVERAELTQAKNSKKKKGEVFSAKDQARLTLLNKVATQLSALRKTANSIYTSDTLTADEKEQKIEAITMAQINLARVALGKEKIEY